MTDRIRKEVVDNLEELADDMENEAAQSEAYVEDGRAGAEAETNLNAALAKRVSAAYYRRAAALLKSDKKGVTL